jgi:RND family efflux transporter MFP subunit
VSRWHLTVAALLSLGWLACSGNPAAKAPQGAKGPGEPARTVRVVPAGQENLPRVVVVSGTLAAEDQVDLGLKVAGRLDDVPVDLGSRVTRGQVLARLITTDAELRVQQAEAALQQARARLGLQAGATSEVVDPEKTPVVRQARAILDEARAHRDRIAVLHADRLVSRSELETAESELQVADGSYHDALDEVLIRQAVLAQRATELEQARQQLRGSELRAPFDGAIRERLATPGAYVAAGQTVVTLVRVHPLRLRLAVPEREASAVRVGQEVRLTVEGDPVVYHGRVVRLSPAIDERSRTLLLEAEVPNPDGVLRPGTFATAEIRTAADEPAVVVPESAIVTFAGIEKVIVVEEGRTIEKRVRTGRRQEGKVEIAEGLAPGEQVVAEPGNLTGGLAVTAAR